MTELDCTGLPCPQPVLKCKRCIEDEAPAELAVVVDNPAAKDNVTRFLESRGYAVASTRDGGNFRLAAERQGDAPNEPSSEPEVVCPAPDGARTTVFITSDRMGRGDDELGAKLMLNFLATLPELGHGLWRLILVNAAVRLACAGHEGLASLEALASSGVHILVCGTCLGHFGLLESKAVGETTNMLDVVTSLHLADKVIQV